jgi:integrase
MGERTRKYLDALAVQRTIKAGRHPCGPNLYLRVQATAPDAAGMVKVSKGWIFRYALAGKRRDMGLGPYPAVSLAEARRKAEDARKTVAEGKDPVAEARAAASAAGAIPTFEEAAARYIAAHEDSWRNPKHRQQWSNTLATYAFPVIGKMSVADVAVGDVLRVLEPVWKVKPETASRLRGRIETVIDWAIARDYRTAENPARWRGRLQQLLPAKSKVSRVEHHAALPWREVGAFLAQLRERTGPATRALEFAILTAARSGEVRGATWAEIDFSAATWTIPGERMKARRDHRVPLSDAAMAVLLGLRADHRERYGKNAIPAPDAFIFLGGRDGKRLSENAMLMVLKRMDRTDITGHGFRSSFRDWCAEATAFPREVAEAALAHVNKDRVESAYLRGDHLEKRRRLMQEWAAFCSRGGAEQAASVVSIRAVTP